MVFPLPPFTLHCSRRACAFADAAVMFTKAFDSGQSPAEFVSEMRKKNQLIMGIGHRCVCVFHRCVPVEWWDTLSCRLRCAVSSP